MPGGVHAVLMPGHITRISLWFIKDQSTVNQNVLAKDFFNGIQKNVVRDQPMGPAKKQVETIESLQRACLTVFQDRPECRAKEGGFFARE